MARIVFELEIDASAKEIAEALTTQAGIAGWWTDDVSLPGGVGATMTLAFPIAPLPFQLRIDKADEQQVAWTSVAEFPPHWAGTRVVWTLAQALESTTVHFAHEGSASDHAASGSSALTWARLMDTLNPFSETATPPPPFPAP